MKKLILSIAISVMILTASLASGQNLEPISGKVGSSKQDVKAIYGRIKSISYKIVAVNNTIIALPEKVSVYSTNGSPISFKSLKVGDYVAVTLLSKTKMVIKMVTRQETNRYRPLDVR